MMTAAAAAERGLRVVLLEPNESLGKKLRITGKGRCNVTNNCECPAFLKEVRTNGKFLRPALYRFPPSAAMEFFENAGVPLKTERGGRVFPQSDKAQDVVDALRRKLRESGVQVKRVHALSVETAEGKVCGVKTSGEPIRCRAAVLCTGGVSYPATGSTGDGFRMAEELGHTVTSLRASLVPLEADAECEELQGLSLRNVTLRLYHDGKCLYEELGEMLFTHFGISGPLILTASTFMSGDPADYRITVDLKPGLTPEKLDERILRDFSENLNRCFKNSLDALLPQKLIGVVLRRSGIDPETRVNSITRTERLRLVGLLKSFELHPFARRPLTEAIITAGGVDVSEVNPRTMESKLVHGLYFAGEILDVDACTGGYNLQIAWSTAVCAAGAIEEE